MNPQLLMANFVAQSALEKMWDFWSLFPGISISSICSPLNLISLEETIEKLNRSHLWFLIPAGSKTVRTESVLSNFTWLELLKHNQRDTWPAHVQTNSFNPLRFFYFCILAELYYGWRSCSYFQQLYQSLTRLERDSIAIQSSLNKSIGKAEQLPLCI